MITVKLRYRPIFPGQLCSSRVLNIPSPSLRHRQATRTRTHGSSFLVELLQECIRAHFLTEEIAPIPRVVADAWGRAWEARLQEFHDPIRVAFRDPNSCKIRSVDVTFVGVFHRDMANLRMLREAVDAVAPDAVALEARPSFLASYVHLAESLPEELVEKLFALPLRNLQEALTYIQLEDRLAWHESLLVTNGELLSHPFHNAHKRNQDRAPPAWNSAEPQNSVGTPAASAPARASNSNSSCSWSTQHPPSSPPSFSSTLPSSSSSLTAEKVVAAFLSRELVLSEKMAAVLLAAERGVPLHGVELDEASSYAVLIQGPLTAPAAHSAHGHGHGHGPPLTVTTTNTRGDAAADQPTTVRGLRLDGDGDSRRIGNGSSCCKAGLSGSDSTAGGSDRRTAHGAAAAAAAAALGMDALEAEQRRMALASLEPDVAAAFQEWFRSIPPGDLSRVLQHQLMGLMTQCMGPESYMSYVDMTDALCSDERRVGRALAEQHWRLTAMREEHFLERLRQVAAGGGPEGGPCRRLVVVLGRAHAARLRRAQRQQHQMQPPPP